MECEVNRWMQHTGLNLCAGVSLQRWRRCVALNVNYKAHQHLGKPSRAQFLTACLKQAVHWWFSLHTQKSWMIKCRSRTMRNKKYMSDLEFSNCL